MLNTAESPCINFEHNGGNFTMYAIIYTEIYRVFHLKQTKTSESIDDV